MPGIEDFRKRAKQMTEKARHHSQEEAKTRKTEEVPESPAERAKLRDAEEAPEPELEPESEKTEDLRRRRDDEM
ncbi:MAG: hypothetical protein JO362_20660 [Streptomycetaceae bacterium]|nr:hypothetical protein [Streptomycetaceae bacterium]